MKKLNANNTQNDREIGWMFGKAMCAYANAMQVIELDKNQYRIFMAEYEATVRCIDMFVEESIYEIQLAVIDACKEEFGIQ